MPSRPVDPDADICPLPQCGFGTDIHFDSLITSNPFIYRVYTPKERSPFADDTDPFFIAPRFDEQFARSPADLPKVKFFEPLIGSYADVAQHMDWTSRTSSCYVSTSFNFGWSIWEAVRRYHQGMKKDVEIAIIDANALGGRAATAMQLLQKSTLEERTDQFWKWYRFSQDSQSVLVYGMVPRTAVLASIPLLQIIRKLPSYFLQKDTQTIVGNPLDQLAWNYALRKQNYRNFCQDMSALFLGRPADVRLRDSTAGAVRLALGFLRPFFHHVVQDDFDIAITYLRNLAISISIWPGGQWARNHPEVRQIIEAMVLAIGEELKEKYSTQKQGEINRLQLVISDLQQTIELQGEKSRLVIENVEIDSDGEGDFDLVLAESEEPTLVGTDLAKILRKPPSLEMSVTVIPRIPVTFQTPITPPESPRNSLFLPATTLPHGIVLSPTSISFGVVSEDTQIEQAPEIPSNKNTPISEEPASPPPTPPATFHDVSFLPLPALEEVSSEEDLQVSDPVGRYLEEEIVEDLVHEDANEVSEDLELHDELQAFPTASASVMQETEQGVEIEDMDLGLERQDDGDETELEAEQQEEEHYVPPSPSNSWVRVRPKFSSFSSMSSASSITSVETLCEPAGFPAKRVSLVADDSFEIVPPFAGFRSLGVASRTISFSETEPSPKLYQPLPLPFIHGALDVPLPPSPSGSSESISPLDSRTSTVSRTRTSSPSPPSPTLPSLSPQSSCPSTPRPSSPLELHAPRVVSTTAIILPRQQISLLAPLGTVQEDKDRPRTRGTRSTVIVDAASYAVTGFLIGAFITLFLFSTQRKTLMVLT